MNDKFQCMKTIREIALNDGVIAFLEEAHASLKANGATNPQGLSKRPLLHYSAMQNCTKLLHFLLQNGAAVDCCDQNKQTPLFWAAEYDALESVEIWCAVCVAVRLLKGFQSFHMEQTLR